MISKYFTKSNETNTILDYFETIATAYHYYDRDETN